MMMINKRNNVRLAAALLVLGATLGLSSGCGGGLQGAAAAAAAMRLQEQESARLRTVAAIEQLETSAQARILRNPVAFGALVAIGNAAAKDFADDTGNGLGLVGGAYCLFNAEECGNLAADLLDFSAKRGRLVAEVRILDGEIARLTTAAGR